MRNLIVVLRIVFIEAKRWLRNLTVLHARKTLSERPSQETRGRERERTTAEGDTAARPSEQPYDPAAVFLIGDPN